MNEDVLFVIAKDGAPISIQIYGVSLFVASLEAENYSSSIFSCLPQFFTVAKFMQIIQIPLNSGDNFRTDVEITFGMTSD